MDNSPHLIEPGVYSFNYHLLKKCQNYKIFYYNILFNLFLFILFILFFYFLLKYKHKDKNDTFQKYIKNKNECEYVLNKIKLLQIQKNKQNNMITNLPQFEENELLIKNYYNN